MVRYCRTGIARRAQVPAPGAHTHTPTTQPTYSPSIYQTKNGYERNKIHKPLNIKG